MISRWKHPIAIGLLVIFAFATCLSGLVLNVQLISHRAAMKNPEGHSKTVLLISDAEIASPGSTFQWKSENEFSYRNEVYDAVELTKVNDGWVIVCVNDSFEQSILDLLNDQTSGGGDDEKALKKNFKFCDELLDFPQTVFNHNYLPCVATSIIDQRVAEPHHQVPVPPPWLG